MNPNISLYNNSCVNLHKFPKLERCDFVEATETCHFDEGFIQYVQIIYCSIPTRLFGAGLFASFLWLLVLFLTLGITADSFFCKSLTVISQLLGISENVAGVTFLAFGNGAADVFSASIAIVNSKDADPSLAIGSLFGAGIFVTSVVCGAIAIPKPFQSMKRPILRDIIFYLVTVFWIFKCLYIHRIDVIDISIFLILYVIYIATVITGHVMYNKSKMEDAMRILSHSPSECSLVLVNKMKIVPVSYDNPTYVSTVGDEMGLDEQKIIKPQAREEEELDRLRSDKKEIVPKSIKIEDRLEAEKVITQMNLSQLWSGLSPIHIHEWREMNLLNKILACVQAPITLMLHLTVPVVDKGVENNNWNRLVNALHVLTFPQFALFATKNAFIMITPHLSLYAFIFILSTIVMSLVLLTSQNNFPPVYHNFFSFIGFASSIIWIYIVANEIVNCLQMVGYAFNLSDTIVGLTFLALGNSVGDFVANYFSAKAGYSRMAISAVYGGPLFNMLLGLGIPFAYKFAQLGTKSIYFVPHTIEYILVVALALNLIIAMIYLTLNKFYFSKAYGYFSMAFYLVFLIIAILAESNVIKF
ncbi:hypothetical protein SNEBB_001765 [Seison nebaliae]|nr:hypothetical protein SNEBB_001765 [Seison nebaliae]